MGARRTSPLERLARNGNDANALLDLSIVVQLMGQRHLGLSVQVLALDVRRLYHLPCSVEPEAIRVLAMVCPGDLSENNALEFLVEDSDTTLHLLYVSPDLPLPKDLPDHDLAIIAVSESEDRNRPLAAAHGTAGEIVGLDRCFARRIALPACRAMAPAPCCNPRPAS